MQLFIFPPLFLRVQIIFRKVADLKHEQELEEMQQNQPQQEFSQDHIVRRLISKFRKPSDAGAIGGLQGPGGGSSNTLQVPLVHPGGAGGSQVATISGQLGGGGGGGGATSTDSGHSSAGAASGSGAEGGARISSSIARTLAGKQSRWSQLVVSAAAGAAGGVASAAAAAGTKSAQLLDVARKGAAGTDGQPSGESSSNRSSADGGRDDEMDENYFRPGGKGHQALLDNMDKR